MEPQFIDRRLDAPERAQRLSYKFQRLRERLREAIETGVLSGKLPGERVLARQFRVNAKTLSKALTDLASEGLLERTIGRGTFVRGSTNSDGKQSMGRWLLLIKPGTQDAPLVQAFKKLNDDCEIVDDGATLRPSFLSGFTAAIDIGGVVPETVLRDLILRGMKVVLIDALPKSTSTHTVLIDRLLPASRLLRSLAATGHKSVGIVETLASSDLHVTLRDLCSRDVPGVELSQPDLSAIVAAANTGTTAFICDAFDAGRQVVATLKKAGLDVGRKFAVASVGLDTADTSLSAATTGCSGFAVTVGQLVETVRELVVDVQIHKPRPVWLLGSFADHGTAPSVGD